MERRAAERVRFLILGAGVAGLGAVLGDENGAYVQRVQTFAPGEVWLGGLGGIPLAQTLGRAVLEVAAAMIVRTCQVYRNEWHPVTPEQVGKVIVEEVKRGVNPWALLNRTFPARPDFIGLFRAGFLLETEEGWSLTPAALHRIARWVVPWSEDDLEPVLELGVGG